MKLLKVSIMLSTLFADASFAFAPKNTFQREANHLLATQLHMSLFNGVKEAFTAPTIERSEIDADRETPIDRWMGWTVVSEKRVVEQIEHDFVDAMDETNYIEVELAKPMGIIFEENDAEFGGIYVQSLKEGSVASESGILQVGDQLVAVGSTGVNGFQFEEALNEIVDCNEENTKLIVFRGSAEQLYGPTGASKAWLKEFVAKEDVKTNISELKP